MSSHEQVTQEVYDALCKGRVEAAVAYERERLLDADWLSNVIRQVDGNNTMGAGALAEKIVDAIRARGTP